MKGVWEADKKGEDGKVDPCKDGGPPTVPGYIHPIISLILFPSMTYGVGFPPPFGFGPPLTPMGAAYLGLGLVDQFWSGPIEKCGAEKELIEEDCDDLLEPDEQALLAKKALFGKPKLESDPDA